MNSFSNFLRRQRSRVRRIRRGGRPLLTQYALAQKWIAGNTVNGLSGSGAGIRISHRKATPYPEVTGYYIPTLLNWGHRDLALKFARWLVTIQREDGSWAESGLKVPYTFDTGQILKGLMALADIEPGVEKSIVRGCDWMLTQIEDSGRIRTPDESAWEGLRGGRRVPEAIHLYTLEPLRDAGKRWGVSRYLEAVDRATAFYLADPELTRFNTLSHFHAYVVEALVDLGFHDRARKAMEDLRVTYGTRPIPAYSDVRWLCSTGLFQYAVIAYKLGMREAGDRYFERASRMQNRSGGFYGSYGLTARYFPRDEISWAVKYFLDALELRIKSSFDGETSTFPATIDSSDGRYDFIRRQVAKAGPARVADLGCGKGRFLKALGSDFPGMPLVGMDISESMLEGLPSSIQRATGSLLRMPFPDGTLDFAFSVEALEHAIDIPSAIREMGRIVAEGGTLVIIDKNQERQGQLDVPDWEQWFRAGELSEMLTHEGFSVEVERNIPYDRRDGRDGLFIAWVARKRAGRTAHKDAALALD
jgi:malonyl-CoA O-methyltransferase